MPQKYFRLVHQEARRRAAQQCMNAPDGWIVKFAEETRTLEQNSKLWPMLQDVSRQVEWYGQKLTDEEWKDVFTAALKRQKVVPGIDGGFVVCGMRTSTMPKSLFCELLELIYAFGAQHGVVWSDPKEARAA
jgi:hypothetical protein